MLTYLTYKLIYNSVNERNSMASFDYYFFSKGHIMNKATFSLKGLIHDNHSIIITQRGNRSSDQRSNIFI